MMEEIKSLFNSDAIAYKENINSLNYNNGSIYLNGEELNACFDNKELISKTDMENIYNSFLDIRISK